MKKRKVLYVSGTRAEYGLMRETLRAIQCHPKLKLEIAATGMHLMNEFGRTVNEIKKDGFKIDPVNAVFRKDTKESVVDFIGRFMLKFADLLDRIKPDIILLLGDRPEMLSSSMAGAYLGIPVAHVHGGDVSLTIDEFARHAITKFSHIHFAATQKSAERIIKLGEDPWRVFVVGAPGLDSIFGQKLLSKKEIAKKYDLNLSKPLVMVLQHAVTMEKEEAPRQMKEMMDAVKELGLQTVVIYPNADPGGRAMIKVIEQYRKLPYIRVYKNIIHKDYLSLMKVADVMVGNSSGGIIESPSFHLPSISVGTRQKGRERTDNVIETGYDKEEIKRAIRKALYDKKFLSKVKRIKNPYGQGKAASKIAGILARIKIDKKLLEKQITY